MKLGIAIIVCLDVCLVIFGIGWKSSQGTGPSRCTIATNQETVAVMNKSSTDADFIYESESGPIYRSKEHVQSEAVYASGPYRIRLVSYMRGFDEFMILRDGKIVHQKALDNVHFYGGAEADEQDGTKFVAVPAIIDINKNGIPDLVVREQWLGHGCCCTYHVFELGKELKRLGEFAEPNYYDNSIFTDLDGDGVLEIIHHENYDDDFSGSGGWFVQTAIMRYRDGGYHVDVERMRQKRMTDQELARSAADLRKAIQKDPKERSRLEGEILDMLYGGNGDQALRYIELAWPEKVEGKADCIEMVKYQLAGNPYVREMTEARRKK